jgi:hypothetical protein
VINKIMNSTCHLCGRPRKLCRSHILPEFLYRPLYDEEHRYFVVTAGTDCHRPLQRGLTEKLLCKDCEERLGRYEKYAAEVMSGRLGHRYQKRGSRIIIKDIDYARFKLFQLSILWRGSVSSLEFFRLVSLGPHEQRLRDMILREDPGIRMSLVALLFLRRNVGRISVILFSTPSRYAGAVGV